MSNTLQQVKAKADAANIAERVSTGADSSAAELEEIELQMLRGIFGKRWEKMLAFFEHVMKTYTKSNEQVSNKC